MSIDSALAFLDYVRTREQVRRRIGQLKGAGAIADLAVIAAAEGFVFTEQDYRAAVIEAAQGELTDAALERFARETGMLPDDGC